MSSFLELNSEGWDRMVAEARARGPATEEDIKPGFTEGALRGFFGGIGRGEVNTVDFLQTVGPDLSSAPEYYDYDPAPAGLDPETQKELAEHFTEETRKKALQSFTPEAHTVGTVGRVLGGLGEMVVPLTAGAGNPALLVGSQTLSSGKRLVDEGVDAGTAAAAAATEGAATYLGVKVPILGKTLGQRVFTGMGGNVGLGMASTFAEQKILEGNGYEELAQAYDPLDPEGRAVDLLLGAAFGVITHAGQRLAPSERNAVMTAANARHFQVDSAPGRPLDAAASAEHQKAMSTALDQMDRGEPVTVHPEVLQANFEQRPARAPPDDDVIRETIGDIPEPRPLAREASGPVGEAAVRNPLTFDASPEVKLQELKALTAENVPVVQKIVDTLNERLAGTKSKLNIKEDSNILSKASRPSILKKKPWYGIEHIRDALRFKTVLDRIDQLPQIVDVLKENGIGIEKVDTAKLLEPGEWGWRIVALDLRMPNGQLVEHYMPIKELESAKKSQGHKLFEKWRNTDVMKLAPEQRGDYLADLQKSKDLYQAAWEAAAARTGLDDTAALASLKSLEASASSLTASNSLKSSPVTGTSVRQTPSTRTAATSGVKTTTVSGDSRNLKTDMGTSSGIIPDAGLDSPNITAAKALLEQQDVQIPTGEIDADGNPVTRSGREIAAQWEVDIAKAEAESVKFEAAVSCFLTQGTE